MHRPRNSRHSHFESHLHPRFFPLEFLESRLLLAATIDPTLVLGSPGDDTGISGIAVGTGTNPITYLVGSYSGVMKVGSGRTGVSLTAVGGSDIFFVAVQKNAVLFAKSFGGVGNDSGNDVFIANNSVYIVGSYAATMDANPGTKTLTLSSLGGTDAFIAKFDLSGNLQTAVSYGGNGNDTGDRIKADTTGNLYILGTFAGTSDLDPSSGVTNRVSTNPNGDTYLIKISPTFNLIWVNHFTSQGTLTANDIDVSGAGIAVVTGTFVGSTDLNGSESTTTLVSSTFETGFVEELTSAGTFGWDAVIGQPITNQVGAVELNDVALDAAGDVVVGGRFTGTVDIRPGTGVTQVTTLPALANTSGDDSFFGFIEKLNPQGAYVYSGILTGTAASEVLSVAIDDNSNIFITGDFAKATNLDFLNNTHTLTITAPTGTTRSVFIASYDTNGKLLTSVSPSAATGDSHGLLIFSRSDVGTIIGGDFFGTVTFANTPNRTLTTNGGIDNFELQVAPAAAAPGVTLTTSATNVIPHQVFTLTATVVGTTTGTVAFKDSTGSITFGTAPLAAGGIATLPLVLSAPGTLVFEAVASGGTLTSPLTSGTVTVTAAFTGAPVGNLDSISGAVVRGWAADDEHNTTAVVVQILIDGRVRAAIIASNNRPDVVNVVGNANHGFSFALPPLDAGTHSIQAVAFDVAGHSTLLGTMSYISSSIFFDEAYYLANNPDVAAAVASGAVSSAFQHYITTGAHEGRNPSPFFNELWYRANNPDIATAVANGSISSGFFQFINSGSHEGRDPSPLFNETFYRRANPDVAAAVNSGAVISGFAHFLESGLYEGRSGTPWFNAAEYVAANPDVSAAIANGSVQAAYLHFVTSGIAEDRAPSHLYVESAYLSLNPDIGAAVGSDQLPNGLTHFINTGFFEGRVSDPTFDTSFYLAQHPDVNALIANGTVKSAFQHFLLFGQLEGFAEHA